MAYYDGAKLLSMKDLDGNQPEIYICTTNRTGGKTTYFSRYLVNRYIKNKEKFCLLYRYSYELSDVSDKFFKDINTLFFNEYVMIHKAKAKGSFYELFICKYNPNLDMKSQQWESCGYAVALNTADQLKKYSHLFSDIQRIMFDEFQSETNNYTNNEIRKFISIHTTIARGQGKQIRYVPVFMISNPVSLINPYYTELGISARLQKNTKFLKGHGFVMEQGFIKSASDAQLTSAFNKAFQGNRYLEYSACNIYLNDSQTFIEKVNGKSRYLATIKYENKLYAVREFQSLGIVYCDNNPDLSFPYKLCVTTEDHQLNYVMINRNSYFILTMRDFFERGVFRFKNLACKEVMMKILSY